ncbi:uncharacterized skeletal organic matrix protein 5 [Nematostella vectensis]|uniref:uncharacterized skeletal organic matrix protein 5 n=1 Tax=Nematostella vectensis TaxID=45351 RepID=UPI0020774C4E|nr:uncharacterized skeletal organic matrix protein 5 [Nematostella vectensis]
MTKLIGCDPGKWTLAVKVDGKKTTFLYDSAYWYNQKGYNYEGGKALDDGQETKLPTFWDTPMRHVCMGMRNSPGTPWRWVQINVGLTTTLASVFSTNKLHTTSIPRSIWLGMIGPPSGTLQSNCNRQGFNAKCDNLTARARIGIVANNEVPCDTCDSFIGIGTSLHFSQALNFSSGNECSHGCTDATGKWMFERYQSTFGVILIKL